MVEADSQLYVNYNFADWWVSDITGNSKDVRLVETKQYEKKHATGVAQIELHKLYVNRGMDWEEACSKEVTMSGLYEGFYLSKLLNIPLLCNE